ncbi:TylF/MycF/NovP-related O-methyltransferase [Pseudomonadota bacterium]
MFADAVCFNPQRIRAEQKLAVRLRQWNYERRRFYLQHIPDFERLTDKPIEIGAIRDAWAHKMEVNNIGDLNRLYCLGLNLKEVLGRCESGAIAELGVFQGNSAKILHMLAPDRTLYLFDTFEGLPEDDLKNDGIDTQAPRFSCGMNSVQEFIGQSENIIYCKGYFPKTTNEVKQGTKFAFVHLDCDLYTPIKAGLEYFYPNTLSGGVIVVHDYLSGYWPGVKIAVDEFLVDKPEHIVHIPDKSGSVIFVKS